MSTTKVTVSRSAEGDLQAHDVVETPYTGEDARQMNVSSRVNEGGAVKLSIGGNGDITDSTQRIVRTTTAREEAPTDILDTAMSSFGRPLSREEVTPESVVSYQGTQIKVKAAMQLGLIKKSDIGYDVGREDITTTSDVENAEAAKPADQTYAMQPVYSRVLQSVVDTYGAAAEQAVFNTLTGAEDKVDVNRIADATGRTTEQVAADLNLGAQAVTNQLKASLGIDDATLSQLVQDMAKDNDRANMQNAVRELVRARSSRAFVEMASIAMRRSTPSEQYLQDKGIKTVTRNGEVIIIMEDGTEVSAKVARRLGWV